MEDKAHVVRATLEHVEHVARNCREVDRQEILLSSGLTPESALTFSFERRCAAWCGMASGEPVCVFGVNLFTDIDHNNGVPWMAATDGIDAVQMAVLRRSRVYYERMAVNFDYLENYVWDENATAKRWLKWTGFTIGEPETYGLGRAQFRRFWKGDSDVH